MSTTVVLMESDRVPKEIYQNNLRILSNEPFSSDIFGGLNRETSVPEERISSALKDIKYAHLLGSIRSLTIMQLYEHAKIEPGKVISPERSQTTIHLRTDTQEVFYEFERSSGGLIETRKLLTKTEFDEAEAIQFDAAQHNEHSETVPLYNSYEWVTTHAELIALNGLTKALLAHNHNS